METAANTFVKEGEKNAPELKIAFEFLDLVKRQGLSFLEAREAWNLASAISSAAGVPYRHEDPPPDPMNITKRKPTPEALAMIAPSTAKSLLEYALQLGLSIDDAIARLRSARILGDAIKTLMDSSLIATFDNIDLRDSNGKSQVEA